MEEEEFIEIYEKDGEKRIRGLIILVDPNETPELNSIMGIAKEDIKKGQVAQIKL